MLLALTVQLSDGKDEALRVLYAMMMRDGITPNAKLLRCAWHIIDRAIWRIFGSFSREWQFALVRIFWIWQQQETHDAVSAIFKWLKTDFFAASCVQDDMSPKDKSLFIDFVDTLNETRMYWARSHNIEVRGFDARVNTFVESNNAVLTDRVGVTASMNITTVVRKEDFAHSHRGKKLAYAAHQSTNRTHSHAVDFDNIFKDAEQHMCQIPLKYLKEQVAVASACLACDRTKSYRCPHATAAQCTICTKYLTDTQRTELALGPCIVIHMRCHLPEPGTKVVKFDTLTTPFVNLLKTMPRFKHWRVVTCREVSAGRHKLLCSCGYGQRHLMTCLHTSFSIQKPTHLTQQQQFGCELENIHIRHTKLYASLRATTNVKRTHNDWSGVHFNATDDAIFTAFPLPQQEDDDDNGDEDNGNGGSDGHGHGTRERGRKQQLASEELLKKKERIANMRSQCFEILNVLDTIPFKEFDEIHAPGVENGLLAIRQNLPVFPLRTTTTIAHRPAGQRKRAGRGGGGAAATRPAVARDVDSDTDDVPEANFHFNPMTRMMEYRSSGASGESSDDDSNSDSSASAPQHPPQRQTRMYLTADRSAWFIDSQPDPDA
jgi:hypothetical protein